MIYRRLGAARTFCALAGLLAARSLARAEVRLPAIIGDHMVLQQGERARIWGTAEPGEQVAVELGRERRTAVAGADRRWEVRLDARPPGGPFELRVTGRNAIVVRDVLVGEVWLCSGQSNMVWPVAKSADGPAEVSRADHPEIRLCKVEGPSLVPDEPQADVKASWQACRPESAADFSAVAYYFARQIRKRLGRPVGVIQSARSGTPAEAWTSRPALLADPAFRPILDNWRRVQEEYPRLKQEHDRWRALAAAAKAEGRPRPPEPPMGGRPGQKNTPSGLYNLLIAPLAPYRVRGVLWYQGESNVKGVEYVWTTSFHDLYGRLFPALIRDWRRAWGVADLPFLFVQLANLGERAPSGGRSPWAEVREAQLRTLALPRTGMAVAADIGEANDIHPRNKQEVGRRLALAALAVAYGRSGPSGGPVYRGLRAGKGEIRLRFDSRGGRLELRGDSGEGAFAVAGEDRNFVPARARVDGSSIVVSSPGVPRPIAARYAWADNPACTLFNTAGLPASPFRTDDWPLE